MSLDPRERDAWRGFLDLLRPPPGYRVVSALGTTFGLGFDALVAAFVAMLDGDPAALARDPAAAVLAVTRLAPRVRVLLHAGTIEGRVEGLEGRLVAMLDRVLVPVSIDGGLFHPKLWALRFAPLGEGGREGPPPERARLVVASRNLTSSRSFEMGIALDGAVSTTPSPLADDVARTLRPWIAAAPRPGDAVRALPDFFRRIEFEVPREGRDGCRLRVQGAPGTRRLHEWLPRRLGDAIVVAPFLRAELVAHLSARGARLRVVSSAESLSELGEGLLRELEAAGASLFVVEEIPGGEDDERIAGIHAKLVIAEGYKGGEGDDERVTFLGSANATGPGWGLRGRSVEAMLELRPGLASSGFVRAFLLDERKRPWPWIRRFEAADREPPDPEREAEERLRADARAAACLPLVLEHRRAEQRLVIGLAPGTTLPRLADTEGETDVDLVPWARIGDGAAWRPLAALAQGPVPFEGIDEADVSAFVAVRVRRGGRERVRVAIGDLRLAEADWERRDQAARESVLAGIPPGDLLRALVLGVGTLGAGGGSRLPSDGRSHRGGGGSPGPFGEVPLERLLRAVADDPALVRDLRLLVGDSYGEAFLRFCDDLAAASDAVQAGSAQ